MGEEIQNGDFVLLELTMRADGQVIDTTDEELAEQEDIDVNPPRVVVIGDGDVFESVEEDIIGKEVGYSSTVDVPPSEAFGEHDPQDVDTVSADRIPEDKRRPGEQVEIDGRAGRLETIIGGRARVDFNHPLAGQEIECEFKVKEKVDGIEERAKALIENYIDEEIEVWTETETNDDEEEIDVLYFEVSPDMIENEMWPLVKQNLMQEILGKLDTDKIVVREVFSKT